MLRIILFDTLLCVCCAYALWRGGAPERWTAVIFLAAVLVAIPILHAHPRPFVTAGALMLIVDLLMLLALAVIALKANRDWPMWVAAWQAIGVGTHLVMVFDTQIMRLVYGIMHAALSYPMLLTLVIGTLRHRQRLKTYGVDASWVNSSSRIAAGPRTGSVAD